MLFKKKITTDIIACFKIESLLSTAFYQDFIPDKELRELMEMLKTDFSEIGYSSMKYQFTYIYNYQFLIEPLTGDGIHLPKAKKVLRKVLVENKSIIQKYITENANSYTIPNPNFEYLLNIYDEGRFEVIDRQITENGEVLQIVVVWEPDNNLIHY
ncbi:MAG: hypothetical protein R3283_09370 [Balneolaceae bacterium]|nr:hypothetical protein [Balneolaceae bacterium]